VTQDDLLKAARSLKTHRDRVNRQPAPTEAERIHSALREIGQSLVRVFQEAEGSVTHQELKQVVDEIHSVTV